MFFYLALRNIVRNKKNSAIIALLIAVSTFLFFIGNSIIGRADRSVRDSFVENLTGDVVVQKAGEVSMNLFGANTPIVDDFFVMPVFPAYDAAMEILESQKGIAGITSQVSGRAYMDFMDVRGPVLLCGVDAANYFSLFPGIVLEEGEFLRAGEYGAMITSDRADNIEKQIGKRPSPGTPMVLTVAGNTGFRIREIPLTGIFHYQNPGQFMNELVIVDPQTVRFLNAIQVAGSANVEVGEDALDLLSADSDDIFGESFFDETPFMEEGFSAGLLQSFLQETPAAGTEAGGDWNFILLRLEKGVSQAAFISSLNKKLGSYGLTAVNWRTAAGTSALLTLLIQLLFNAGMLLINVASVIAAINILLISVFRRTREIGTLRTIGAQDSYIRFLILGENLLIALAAGLTGVLGGAFFLRWMNRMEFVIPNDLIASLLGGYILRVEFLFSVAFVSFIMAAALGIIASIYPVEMAVRIEPAAAIRRR